MGGDGASADSDFDFDDGGLDDALLASLALPNDLLREQGGGGGGSGDVRAQPLTTARDDSPRDGAKHSPAASAFALKRPTSRLSMKAKPSPRGTAKPSPRSTAKPSSPRQLTLEAAFKRPLVLQQTSSAASTPRPVTTARPTKTQLKPLCDVDLDTDGSVVVIDEESDANAENQRPLSTSKANHFSAYAFQPPDSGYRQSEIIQQPQNVAQRPLQLSNNHTVDEEACRTWIYPTNYPVRSYQLNIVGKALFHNMLVSLPTGLGKTFIAAVVMYNYWR